MIHTIWMSGEWSQTPGLAHLADALRVARCRVEMLDPQQVSDWDTLISPLEPWAQGPSLMIFDAPLASADDWALLRSIDASTPWRSIPRVVVDHAESAEMCQAAYRHRVASYVVVPDAPEGLTIAERFAAYWTQVMVLPDLAHFQADP